MTQTIKRATALVLIILTLAATFMLPVSAASYTTNYDKSVSELKELFPNGAYWNSSTKYNGISTYTWSPCSHAHGHCSYNGSCGCGTFKNYCCQCMGFAYALQYYAFQGYNGYVRSSIYNYTTAMNQLKPGDIIRYGNHSIFVTGVSGNTITYADCNSDGHCKIRWDVTTTKAAIGSSFKYLDPAPRAISGAVNNSSSSSSGSYTARCTARSGLYIRSGASTAYSVIGGIPYGAYVTVLYTSGSWARVNYNGIVGWSSLSYLS